MYTIIHWQLFYYKVFAKTRGKILNSEELADLLYIAYNRDEAEVFSIDRAIRSGYEELYTTAPDILDKKMELLDKEVEKEALTLINEKVTQVRSRKQQEIEEKEANFGEIIRRRAEALLRQNASYIGKDTTKEAIEMKTRCKKQYVLQEWDKFIQDR